MLTAVLFVHLAATGVHDSSSRSHAVLRIYIQRGASSGVGPDGRTCSVPAPEGVLTLVDLAGSEHRIDSMHHSADRRKEGACINASLMALKECIRARAAGQNASHQYRKSKLTMALKASFLFPSARTLIIATVSPASKDTEHSLNTLRHACIMDGQQEADGANEPSSVKETRFVTGGTVEREECGEVDVTDIARKNMAVKKATGKDADARTSNGNTVLPVESQLPETTERQKAKSRRASEKRMFAKLNPECKTLLTAAREKLGNLQRQATRLRVGKPEADERHGTEGAADGSSRWEKSDNFSSAETSCNRYGGSGVSSHATANADNMKAKEREMEAEREREKERERKAKHDKRLLFKKLHDSVYSSAATVPETLLKRQLVTLMKLNGFTASEINAAVPPCETDDLLQPSPPKTEITAGGGVRVNVVGVVSGSGVQIRGTSGERSIEKPRPTAIKSARGRRPSALRDIEDEGSMSEMIPAPVLRTGSASNTKPPTPLASPSAAYSKALQMSASALREDTNNDEILKKKRLAATAAAVAAAAVENTAQTRKTRQEQAKAVRDKIDADKKAALLKKLGRTDDRSYAVEGKLSPEERDRERELDSPTMVHASEIARLQADLASSSISSPIAQSIRKQIQGHQAILERGKLLEGRRPSVNEGSNTGRRRRSSARIESEDDSEVEDRPQSAQLHRPHTPKTPAPRAGEGLRSMALSALRASNRDPVSPRAQMGPSSGDQGGQYRYGDSPGKALKPPRAEGSGSRPHLPIVSGVVEDWGDALEREVLSAGTTGYNSADNSFDNSRSQSRHHGSDVSGTDDNSPHSDRGGGAYQQQGSQWDGDQSHGDRRNQQKTVEQPRRRMSASQQHSYDHEQLQQQQQLQRRQQQQSYLQQQQYQHPQQLQRDGHHNYTQHQQQQHHQQQQQQYHQPQQHNQPLNTPQHPQNTLGQRPGQQEPPKQRMSIQQQHKYEYDQEQIRLAQRQAEQQLRQQQLQQQKQQEQQNFIDLQRRQSNRTLDPEPVPVRHLRSNPAPQHRVGAAAAPWANELSWEREKSDGEI
jgi:Kinesin motor domain